MKRLTIKTDNETLEALKRIADKINRSVEYIVIQALQQYVGSSDAPHPVVTSVDDLAGDFWPEDDTEDFLSFLETAREASQAGSVRRPLR